MRASRWREQLDPKQTAEVGEWLYEQDLANWKRRRNKGSYLKKLIMQFHEKVGIHTGLSTVWIRYSRAGLRWPALYYTVSLPPKVLMDVTGREWVRCKPHSGFHRAIGLVINSTTSIPAGTAQGYQPNPHRVAGKYRKVCSARGKVRFYTSDDMRTCLWLHMFWHLILDCLFLGLLDVTSKSIGLWWWYINITVIYEPIV